MASLEKFGSGHTLLAMPFLFGPGDALTVREFPRTSSHASGRSAQARANFSLVAYLNGPNHQKKKHFWGLVFPMILLMVEILHQLIGSLSHYLHGFIHPRWCRISSINSRSIILWVCIPSQHWRFFGRFPQPFPISFTLHTTFPQSTQVFRKKKRGR